MKNTKAYKVLKEVYENSEMTGSPVFYDFSVIAHNDYAFPEIQFDSYGYFEYVELAKCLNLFENLGYDQLTEVIDYILFEVNQASKSDV